MKKSITLLGGNAMIDPEELALYIYKSLSLSAKLSRKITKESVKAAIRSQELMYHPMWIAKLLVIADRRPFKPKMTPMMCFVDAISGYRGLMSSVPHAVQNEVEVSQIVISHIHNEEEVKDYIKDVQHSQINRSYALKKPEHKIVEHFLVYLPLWKVEVEGDVSEEFWINANTGESEAYMASLWKSEKWLRLKPANHAKA
ncbi:hypothetical protein [Planococcus salinus]|uniref:Uncharacterized protein n=1 Tax=Planococcus salinus TaxID=1848460 RepID=A0A3M8P5Q1_9BACL|nr:hypothetical protein [Planococcus salinus]RNF39008.1 hypothetical protein EEX84_11505 [Planococcus salinus]